MRYRTNNAAGYHSRAQRRPPAGPRMTSTDYYRAHNAMIETPGTHMAAAPLGTLVSGHKKDVVLTNLLTRTPGQHRHLRMAPACRFADSAAQHRPLCRYADYSHGVRLVAGMAMQEGALRPVTEIERPGARTCPQRRRCHPAGAGSAVVQRRRSHRALARFKKRGGTLQEWSGARGLS